MQRHSDEITCNRRLFLLGTASTAMGALLAACGKSVTETVAEADVPVGSAVFVGDVIVAQPTAGRFVAYSRSCPHQYATIDSVEGDTVVCSAHGSVFKIEDGSVIDGPARDPLVAGKATTADGTVTATL